MPNLNSTTFAWVSESEIDEAHIMSKRVSYTIYMWLNRVVMFEVIIGIISFFLLFFFVLIVFGLQNQINSVQERVRKVLEDQIWAKHKTNLPFKQILKNLKKYKKDQRKSGAHKKDPIKRGKGKKKK